MTFLTFEFETIAENSFVSAAAYFVAHPPMITVGAAQGAADISFIGLFLQAHIIVQLVMIGLLVASVWSWAIIFEKIVAFKKLQQEKQNFERQFWSGQSLEDLYGFLSQRVTTGMGAVFVSAMREWKRSVDPNAKLLPGVQMRIEKVMDVSIARELDRLESRLMFLATVGSTAPFIGLFGTVWGIMTSFQAIANSKNTSLAVVAPGIAEALFATALGLLAAIPAVIFYNRFSHEVSRYSQQLEGFADEFSAMLSHQLDVQR